MTDKMKNRLGIWQYIKSYRFNSIFIKNLFMIILIVIIPLAGMSMAVYRYSNNVMGEEVRDANRYALYRVRDMVDMLVRGIDEMAIKIASDTDINDFINNPRPGIPDYITIKREIDIFNNISITNTISAYIHSIYVYSEASGYLISSWKGIRKLEWFNDIGWYDEYMDKKSRSSCWTSARMIENEKIYSSTNYTKYFLSVYRTAPLIYGDASGVIVINIDSNKLGQWVNDIDSRSFEDIFIIDGDGRVIFNDNQDLINKKYEEVDLLEGVSMEDDSHSVISNVKGVRNVLSSAKSKYNGWRFVSAISLYKYQEKLEALKNNMMVLIFISVVISIVFAFLTSVRVYEPIRNIISLVDNPTDWIGAEKMIDKKSIDEFRLIASNIINTYNQKNKTEEELAKRIVLLKKAQTIALQSQINPHFLYNSLDTINWKVMEMAGRNNQASEIILALSELLRISLETSTNLVDIAMEIKHAELYLEIQRARYKNKFDVVWDIDLSIMDYKIIKLTLQPLLENAIYHGIKPKKEKGVISISGQLQENSIAFQVADDGTGMLDTEVLVLNSEMSKDYIKEDEHIGLRNVNQRIKLTFGENYGLTVKSETKKGTVIHVLIPAVKQMG